MNKILLDWEDAISLIQEEAESLERQTPTIKFLISCDSNPKTITIETRTDYSYNEHKTFSLEKYTSLREMIKEILGTIQNQALDEDCAKEELEEEGEKHEEEVEDLLADIQALVEEWNEEQPRVHFDYKIHSDYEFKITASVEDEEVADMKIDCSDIDFNYRLAQQDVINFFELTVRKHSWSPEGELEDDEDEEYEEE